MATRINERAVIIWQTISEGAGEPALLIRHYADNMIGIQQEDKEEVLINVETFPALIKVMKHYMAHEDFKDLRV